MALLLTGESELWHDTARQGGKEECQRAWKPIGKEARPPTIQGSGKESAMPDLRR